MMKLLYLIANQEMVQSVAEFVVQVTKKMDASLVILAASDSAETLTTVEEQIKSSTELFQGVEYEFKVAQGDPVDEMEAELKTDRYDMVLFMVHRRRRVIPSGFRFLSQRIIKHATVPIMLVRNVSKKLERILVCTGGLKISEPVVDLSIKLAGQAALHATLLTVSTAVPSMYTGMDEIEETLEELLETETPVAQHLRLSAEQMTKSGVQAEVKIRHGDVVEAILEETLEGNYDLVVLGETEGSTLRGLLLGNVTQQIINRSPSAVLISKQRD